MQLTRMQVLAGINELNIKPNQRINERDLEILNIISENFGGGDSGENYLKPLSESYTVESEEDLEDHGWDFNFTFKEWETLCLKLKKPYVSNNFFGYMPPKPPYYETCIESDGINTITISAPYIDGAGTEKNLGYFDSKGEYIPDPQFAQYYDENGNRIRNQVNELGINKHAVLNEKWVEKNVKQIYNTIKQDLESRGKNLIEYLNGEDLDFNNLNFNVQDYKDIMDMMSDDIDENFPKDYYSIVISDNNPESDCRGIILCNYGDDVNEMIGSGGYNFYPLPTKKGIYYSFSWC